MHNSYLMSVNYATNISSSFFTVYNTELDLIIITTSQMDIVRLGEKI